MPAGTVTDHRGDRSACDLSADLGDPRSIYGDGIISVVNRSAEVAGVRRGMSGEEAASLMLAAARASSSQSKTTDQAKPGNTLRGAVACQKQRQGCHDPHKKCRDAQRKERVK